jgi:hypothetical protein
MSNIQTFFSSSDLFFEITTDKENLDLKTEIGETLYNADYTKRVIISPSVTIGSATTTSPALSIPSGAGGRIFINNYGSILGAGGAAGGGVGGDAIKAESTCTIENKSSGTIYAGGGGGGTGGTGGTGGQGSYQVVTGSYQQCYQYYSWGGCASQTVYTYGTEYSNGGVGGSGGSGGAGRGYNQSISSGTAGTAGVAGGTNAGAGGLGGTGGSGGDWGTTGTTGATGGTGVNGNYTNGLAGGAGVSGGLAGYYINGLGTYATLINQGTFAGIGTAPPAPTYVNLSFTASGNLTVTGAGTSTVSIFKTSGGAAWDNTAYSTTAFTAPCTIEFNKQADAGDNGVSYAMIGWNEDPTTNSSYTKLDYASYPFQTNGYYVYHNGSQINPSVTWSTANKFYIVYTTDGYIKHYNGSTLLYSVNYGAGKTVYLDSAYYSPNATYGGFSNIRVIESAWDGSSYST